MRIKSIVFDNDGFERTLVRMAHEILEDNDSGANIVLVGILRRGLPIANRLAEIVKMIDGSIVPVLQIDPRLMTITDIEGKKINADDYSKQTIILVDDVLHTGNTVFKCVKLIDETIKDAKIKLATMVDRGHKRYPIFADYLGKNVPTSHNEIVVVSVKGIDKENSIMIYDV